MNATKPGPDTRPLGITSMRAAATWFLEQRTLPRYQSVQLFSRDFHGFLEQLIPQVEQLARARGEDDAPGKVALAGVAEARRRIEDPESAGLHGEVERVKRLARSVVALCSHHDALTGFTMCLVCDRPIEDGDESVPYDYGSPSGGTVRTGRVHAACATRRR